MDTGLLVLCYRFSFYRATLCIMLMRMGGSERGRGAMAPCEKSGPLCDPTVKFVMQAILTQLGGSHMLDLRLYAAGFREQFSFGITLKSSFQEAEGL